MHFLAEGFEGPFPYASKESDDSLRALAATKLPSLTISFVWFQNTINSTTIAPVPGGTPSGTIFHNCSTPTEAALEHTVTLAKSLGMQVILRPMVDLNWSNPANDNLYRGDIGKYFDAQDWDGWFSSYNSYILRYASLAQSWGVDAFCSGAELATPQLQTGHFVELMTEIRKVYTRGPVYYSATGHDWQDVKFWNMSDFVGVDAYGQLQVNQNPDQATVQDLVAAWEPQKKEFAAIAQTLNKSVLFAEFGICSLWHQDIYESPFYYHCTPPLTPPDHLDLDVQTKYYQAFFEAIDPEPWFYGGFAWKWMSGGTGGVNNSNFTPENKPAQALLTKYWGKK